MTAGLGEVLTRRRLGGAVLMLAGLVVAAVVLVPKLGGDRDEPHPVRLVSVPQLGLALAHPATWKQSAAGRALRLSSPDNTAVLVVSSPLAGRHPQRVKAELKRVLLRRLRPGKVVRDGPGRLGARRVRTFEISGFVRNRRMRVLAIVDSTPYRTYALTLFTPGRPSRRRLAEAQQILDTVRFAKPTRRPKP